MILSRILAVSFAAVVLPTLASAVTFVDGTFDSADWSVVTVGDGSVGGVQVGAGGNPDDFYSVTDHPDIGLFVAGYHMNSEFVYDPSVQGAIDTVAWSIDFKNFQAGQHVALAVEQGGVHYLSLPSGLVTTGAGLGVWVTHTLGGFSEAGFGAPDFSESGAPITFGFRTANSYDPVAGDVQYIVGFDNLEITVVPLPVPTNVWGGADWGQLVWGILLVPTLHGFGLTVLGALLAGAGAFLMRRGAPIRRSGRYAGGNLLRLSILFLLLLMPPLVYAASVSLPHLFTNGTLTDAGEMNANFAAVATAVNDNDSRLDTLIDQSCPPGEAATGLDSPGNLLCAPPF